MSQLIAWDIETCPLPLENFSERQMRRHDMEVAKILSREEITPEEASRKARALHPHLGWICAIAFQRVKHGQRRDPWKECVGTPGDEAGLLTRFWKAIDQLPNYSLWLTFNGKGFDVEFLQWRSIVHGIVPSRHDLLDRHKFRHDRHLDLTCLGYKPMGLADACELAGVPSPKEGAVSAESVHQAVEEGRLHDVAVYCAADVTATLDLYDAVYEFIPC